MCFRCILAHLLLKADPFGAGPLYKLGEWSPERFLSHGPLSSRQPDRQMSASIPGLQDGGGQQGRGSYPGLGSREHMPKLSVEGCGISQEMEGRGLVKAERG